MDRASWSRQSCTRLIVLAELGARMTKHLLMIHGIGSDASVWTRMKAGFEADGWTCHTPTLFPDRRTHDTPPSSIADLSFDDYVNAMSDEARRIERETGEKPIVLGHSMGGLIAQVLAERGDVSRAIFLTPAQPKECAVIGLSVVYTFANILLSRDRKKGHKIWRPGFSFGILNRVSRRRHDEIYATALYDSGQVYGELSDGIEIDEQKITIPTLTIAASKDRATLARAVRKVGLKYARSPVAGDFIEYPNNAHWIVDEPGTDKVISDILDWIAGTRHAVSS